jgi:hypothetical protein
MGWCTACALLIASIASSSSSSPTALRQQRRLAATGTDAALGIKTLEHIDTSAASGAAGNSARSHPWPTRALLALYGLQNRDHGCAWPSQKRSIVAQLAESGFAVEVLRFELKPELPAQVDGADWYAGDMLPSDFYESANYSRVDQSLPAVNCTAVIADLSSEHCRYRKSYTPATVKNAQRQLFAENEVAKFMQLHEGRYAVAVALGSDVYVPQPIAAADISSLTDGPTGQVYTTMNNDAGGYTNGLYGPGAHHVAVRAAGQLPRDKRL